MAPVAGDRAQQNRDFGMGRGKVFPATKARSLLNPLRRLVQSARRTVAAVGLRPDAIVLEIGSGPGYFSPSLADAVPGGALVALDLQVEMLRLARDRLRGHHVRRVQADAVRLPFRTGCFDAVFVATMLGEVPDLDACLDEIRRVLAPAGVVSFCETRRDSDFTPSEALTRIVEPHALRFVDRKGHRWQYVARYRAV
jgi:ubiquinone/menaquinone biosynthesis C-methylase UbiE